MRLMIFEKFYLEKRWKNMEKRQLRLDWRNTARVATARLGSKGLDMIALRIFTFSCMSFTERKCGTR